MVSKQQMFGLGETPVEVINTDCLGKELLTVPQNILWICSKHLALRRTLQILSAALTKIYNKMFENGIGIHIYSKH